MTSLRIALLVLAAATVPVLGCSNDSADGNTESDIAAASTAMVFDGDDATIDQLLALAPIGDGSKAAAIVFTADLSVAPFVRGHLVQGGSVTVVFALARLPGCRASHNGVGVWDTRAGGEFSNRTLIGERRGADGMGGTLGRLVSFANGLGGTSGRGHSVPFTFEIPDDTTSFKLYVHNTSPPGPSPKCDTFDSRFEENYSFPIEPSR